mgnify:CR=1 FL=1
MENESIDVRKALHIIDEQLPEGATWDDVIEHVSFLKAVSEGKKAALTGSFADEQELKRVFAKYGVKA